MGTIAAWAGFSGDDVDASELAVAMFDPDNTYNKFGVLHGRLSSDQFSEVIPTWAVQEGSFVCGFYQGFERWHWTYAQQLTGSTTIRHAGLSRRFFLPWDAHAVLWGWQAYCRQDATQWDLNVPESGDAAIDESWTLTSWVDEVLHGPSVNLFHGRENDGATSADTNPDNHAEDRWRYVTVSDGVVSSSSSNPVQMTKGYHTLAVRVNGTIRDPDPASEKIATPVGALWMLAFR